MQLKIKRSQREGGIVSKNMIFCIDAIVHFTPEEAASVKRYKLEGEVTSLIERMEADTAFNKEYEKKKEAARPKKTATAKRGSKKSTRKGA